MRMLNNRDEIIIIKEYWLLDVNDKKDVPPGTLKKITFKSLSSNFNLDKNNFKPDKSTFNEQSKVNKTKVKQTKQNKDKKALSCCVFDTFKDCIHEPTEAEQGALTALCDEHGEYVVKQAIKAAKGKGRSVNYVKGIINNWKKTGDIPVEFISLDKSYDLEEFEKLSLNNPPDKETEDNDAN